MQNPSDLYRFETDVDLTEPRPGVLVVALGAFIDAGEVQRMLSEHLVETGNPDLVATFDVDQLLDYRARRPAMVFDVNRFAEYETPTMLLRRLTDRDGHIYYLLTGPEPDFQWERVVAAIRDIIIALGVTLAVTAHGIPMGVPHTRPVGVTAHATDATLIGEVHSPFGRVQVPGSIGALLELRLGEAGHASVGFSIHVPHYLSGTEFADGSLAALNAIVDVTGLNLPNDGLVAKASANQRAIAAQVEGNAEVQAVVAALEQQYDTFVEEQQDPNLWATEGVQIPSADQLGAEFENFLRTVTDDDTA